MFRTTKGSGRIVTVEVVRSSPREVWLHWGPGKTTKDRRATMFHQYHGEFSKAKAWILADLEIRRRNLTKSLDVVNKQIEKMEQLNEPQ